MKYRLIQMVEGKMMETELSEKNLIPAMEARGFELVGLNHNSSQRSELQDRPVFRNVAGPMWDGGAIRYEDWASNDALSR